MEQAQPCESGIITLFSISPALTLPPAHSEPCHSSPVRPDTRNIQAGSTCPTTTDLIGVHCQAGRTPSLPRRVKRKPRKVVKNSVGPHTPPFSTSTLPFISQIPATYHPKTHHVIPREARTQVRRRLHLRLDESPDDSRDHQEGDRAGGSGDLQGPGFERT